MKPIISKATQKNWERLNPKVEDRLKNRANKTESKRHIIPYEYYENPENYPFSGLLVDFFQSHSYSIESILYCIALSLLEGSGLNHANHVTPILMEFARKKNISRISLPFAIPDDEKDILGIAYQTLLVEGIKNKKGSYYTPASVIQSMIDGLDTVDKVILDPCCGSGAFLLQVNNLNPNLLYGFDMDEIAVFLAKVNLILKYQNFVFEPNIYCLNFLEVSCLPGDFKADYIISNPPWGALPQSPAQTSSITPYFKESFAQFIVKSKPFLKEDGSLIFLLPESFLSVKTHQKLRQYILETFKINAIQCFDRLFTGVTTKYISLSLSFGKNRKSISVSRSKAKWDVPMAAFSLTEGHNFNLMQELDYQIITKILSQKKSDLTGSRWGLGIVTGDNKSILLTQVSTDTEPIYTGKEVTKYLLKPAKYHIRYIREQLQQVAPDIIYRSQPKLVYRFISDKPVFAYDESGSLVLNSANILIPNKSEIDIKVSLALLNSALYQYLYQNLFGGVKVLRSSLESLPFPQIATTDKNLLIALVNQYLTSPRASILHEIDQIVYRLFSLDAGEINHIETQAKSSRR